MQIETVPEVVRDCIFAFEVLRRLDFEAEEIYVAVRNVIGEGVCACVVLRAQGLEWNWTIAPIGNLTVQEFHEEFRHAAVLWNAMPPTDDPWGFQRSRILNMGAEVVTSLVTKGFSLRGAK